MDPPTHHQFDLPAQASPTPEPHPKERRTGAGPPRPERRAHGRRSELSLASPCHCMAHLATCP
eukprot:scaffold23756_cov120-Isochrysis_galbana.AAC.1